MPDAISISAITKSFGHKTALNGVSLSVTEGQIYGFLGPNGAGKTTTIRCLLDLIRPDQGTITISGLDAHQQAVRVKQQLGYMSADNHLYPNWTAAQHLAFAKHMWGKLPLADQLIKRLEMDTKIKAKHLSTGNHQKLGLIMALAHQPRILILDEPTRGLDPLLQRIFQDILAEYRSQGGTVFISSHNLAEVEQVCDQVGIIKNGQMVANESMAAIRDLKAHLVTIAFEKPFDATTLPKTHLEIVQQHPTQLVLKVHGDINPLLQKLATAKVKDLEITHLPLEEIFMSYYRQPESQS